MKQGAVPSLHIRADIQVCGGKRETCILLQAACGYKVNQERNKVMYRHYRVVWKQGKRVIDESRGYITDVQAWTEFTIKMNQARGLAGHNTLKLMEMVNELEIKVIACLVIKV